MLLNKSVYRLLTWAQRLLPVPENRGFLVNDELQYPVPVQRRPSSQFETGIHAVQIPSEASPFHQLGSRPHYVPKILWIVIPIQNLLLLLPSLLAVRSLQVHAAKIQIVPSIDGSKSDQSAPIHAFQRGIPSPGKTRAETLLEARPILSPVRRFLLDRFDDRRDPG